MKYTLLFVLGSCLFSICFARIESFYKLDKLDQEGKCCKCTPVTPVGNFSLKPFYSTWYIVDKSNPRLKAEQKCNRLTVDAINATFANVSGFHKNVWTNKEKISQTQLFRKYDNISGILAFGSPDSRLTYLTNFTVIDVGVDYNSYAVIHVCTRIKFIEFESAYILSRYPNPALNTIDKAKQKLKQFGFNIDHFTAIDQLNC